MTAQPMSQVPQNAPVIFRPGMMLDQKYYLLEPLYIPCFDGEYFSCTDKKQVFTVKIYKNKSTTSALAKAAFSKITNNSVAKILYSGSDQDRAYEILPFYKNGPILGKPMTMDFIKKGLIPSLNEAIHALHTWGIMHKDIKPAHLLFLDNWTGVSLIDCGNSNGNIPYGTKARSPEYAAPETFQQLFLPESDYFSLGISLFELCCGYNPNATLPLEALGKIRDITQCPMADSVPPDIKQLIYGLTYGDISAKQDKTNPNRRWTYEEVKNWSMGKSQATPTYVVEAPSYNFLNRKYKELPELVTAFAKNWEEGKKELFSGGIDKFLNLTCPDYISLCEEARFEVREGNLTQDMGFWRFIYQIYSSLLGFYWKDKLFPSFSSLGKEILKELRSGNIISNDFWEEILNEQLLSQYLQLSDHDHQYLVDGITALEISHSMSHPNRRNQLFHYYTMGFLLSEEMYFSIEKQTFKTPQELYLYMIKLIQSSFTDFEEFCSHLIDSDDILDVQLESWLISLVNDTILDQWKEELSQEQEDSFVF